MTVTYSSGAKEVVVPDSINYDVSKTGTVPVTVVYNGRTATFNITVSPKIVDYISVTAPTVTKFHAGENLDLSGGKVKVVYESVDGYSETFELDASMVSGYDKNVVGAQSLTVTYGGKAATFDIETFVNYTTMVIYLAPGGGVVHQGAELSCSEYMVVLECRNYPQFNKNILLTKDMINGEIDTTTPGEHCVSASYEGLSANIYYTVVVKGDIDGDGKVTMLDSFYLKLFVKQLITPSPENIYDREADINRDGFINMVDVFELKYRVKTGNWL